MTFKYYYEAKKVFLPWIWLSFICVCIVGCEPKSSLSELDKIKQEGVLHVVTRNSPISYFEDRNGETGFEYELAKRFAKKIGVSLEIETADTIDELYKKVIENKAFIIGAAGLVNDKLRGKQVTFSNPYLVVDTLVVYRRSNKMPTSVKGLIGNSILVIKDSAQADLLADLKKQYPELTYQESDTVDVVDLMQMVEDEKIDVALVNSNELSMTQVYYPNVRSAFTIAKDQKVSWIVNHGNDKSVLDAVNNFFDEAEKDGSLNRLINRFYGHIDVLGYVGAFSFAKHLQDRLPKYEAYFVQYAKEYQLDWKLLAAIGYQESHWNPTATSPTGVRGLMMLTNNTAKAMGVEDRLDAKQSIMGGAKFFAKLKARVSDDVQTQEDRILFALAAYNMGQGHVMDARKLATMKNLNPNVWRDVNQVLSLLSQKQWYKQTRYGYARGFETKQFVRNVRRYYDILTWLDQSQREMPTANNTQLHIPTISRNEITTTTESL